MPRLKWAKRPPYDGAVVMDESRVRGGERVGKSENKKYRALMLKSGGLKGDVKWKKIWTKM